MHVEYLYYFKDFSQTLSISKTASNYYMTPQGLSRAIHQLEKDFGVTLTSYQNNVISLTPAGHALSERIDEIILHVEEAKGVLAGYRLAALGSGSRRDSVRITASPCVSQYLTPLIDIQKPGLFDFEVKLREASLHRIAPRLESKDGEGSLGLISIPTTVGCRDLLAHLIAEYGMVYERLFVSPLVALVSSYSALAKEKVIKPEDLESSSIARYQDTVLGDALDDFIKDDQVKTITNASFVIWARIIEDQAVGFAPKLIDGIGVLPSKIVTVPTEGFFNTEFGFMYREADGESPHVLNVMEYVRDKVKAESKRSRYGDLFTLAD